MTRHRNDTFTRRQMLKTAGAAGMLTLFPSIVPASVVGKHAPSNHINVGLIGMGRHADYSNLPAFLQSDDTHVVAVCDVDRWRLDSAKKKTDQYYGNSDCRAYTDWREVIARDDIDAVMISTTDQWHVPTALAAARAKKHICCEKPLSLSVAEGRLLADVAKKQGVVFRTDTECRSNAYMNKTARLVLNGYIGKVTRIEVGVPDTDNIAREGDPTPTPVPEELDYDMWVGPAPMKPYCVDRVHPRQSFGSSDDLNTRPGWLRCRGIGEGVILTWGAHLLDVAQLCNDTERTGPISVEGVGEYPQSKAALWDVLKTFNLHFEYANGVALDYQTGRDGYLRVEGEKGWIRAQYTGNARLLAHDESVLRLKFRDTDKPVIQRGDKEDFIYAIRNNCNTMIDAEVGHRTASLAHIGQIAIQRGKKLSWNPHAERFADDEQANEMLHRPYRKPWVFA
jgi:predicted dehydrogenase